MHLPGGFRASSTEYFRPNMAHISLKLWVDLIYIYVYMYMYIYIYVRTNGTYECIQYSICRGLTTQNGYKTHKPGVEQYPNMYCIPTASYRFTFTYTHKYLHKLFSIHHPPMITNPPTNGIIKKNITNQAFSRGVYSPEVHEAMAIYSCCGHWMIVIPSTVQSPAVQMKHVPTSRMSYIQRCHNVISKHFPIIIP